jgi:hypothetical protein
MSVGCNADEAMWADAVVSATHLHNVIFKPGKSRTPWEFMHGKRLKFGHLTVWGFLVYGKSEKHQTSSFLFPGSSWHIPCIRYAGGI